MFFKDFEFIVYDYTIKTDIEPIVETIVDLTQRVQLKISKEDLLVLCDQYVIPGNMKPEQIAGELYNNPFLHWTIMYMNDMNSIYSDWPINETALGEFVTKKYGSGNEYATHHYEKRPEGITMDTDFILEIYGEAGTLVTNYDYEYEKNEAKRFIKVIKPSYISSFVESFKRALVSNG